jgi:hypothetical protein
MLKKLCGARKLFHVIQGGLENPPAIFFLDLWALCGQIPLFAALPRWVFRGEIEFSPEFGDFDIVENLRKPGQF